MLKISELITHIVSAEEVLTLKMSFTNIVAFREDHGYAAQNVQHDLKSKLSANLEQCRQKTAINLHRRIRMSIWVCLAL